MKNEVTAAKSRPVQRGVLAPETHSLSVSIRGSGIMDDIVSNDVDDDVTMESSTESLNSHYQKSVGYEKLLPYADELDDEARILLAEIKGQLGRAVMLRQLQPGCALWTLKLRRFIKVYSLKFSKDDHIVFIKLMYELVTIPNLEPYFINLFGATLNKLLSKPELIAPEELELPWKPLYDLVKRVIDIGQSAHGIYRFFASLTSIFRTMVIQASIYFPVTATQEILDELRPKLCPLDPGTMAMTVEMLEWFLPLQLYPKDHHLGYKLWFDELMKLWEVCHNAPLWEHNMMSLMARLACHHIGYIDWEPHIPLMFTRFVRCLNLPVYYKQIQGGKPHKIETHHIAIWIISILGNGSSSQMYVDKFLKTIETYLHQANFGPWVLKLKEVLNKLSYFFILRLHVERYGKRTWEVPTPETHKLTDADIDALVKSMMPVAMTAMFSRHGVTEACNALQHLATIRPSLVVPDVLERMYSTLDSLTEPHKLTAAMLGMASVARPMVQGLRNVNRDYAYAEGPSHVLPLLFSFLPGIDANDARKCFVTFRLISIYAVLVPIVDTSRCTAPMDEDERLVSESTCRFEDFVLEFFDKIFSLIESSTLEFLTHENRAAGGGKSKLESMAETAVGSVCSAVLLQTSESIFQSALRELRNFVTERVLETTVSGQLAAVVCRIFARVNGRETLRALVPGLSETILELVGEGDEVLKEENLDNRLLYAMLLLSTVVDTPGNNLLPYVETLADVLDKILHLKSREGSQIASRMLKSIFQSLSNVSSTSFRTNGRDYNDPEHPYFKEWGQGADISDFRIDWYVPGEEEIATLRRLFARYAPPEVTKIELHSAKKLALTREELLTSLNIVSSILEGGENFFPVSDDSNDEPDDPASAWTSFLPTVGIKGEILMPDGSNVRWYLSRTMRDLQRVMLSNSEDDTKSLFALVRIWSSLLLGKFWLHDHFEARCRNFKMTKAVLKDKLVKRKCHLGGVYILQRAELLHERRSQTRFHLLTETHKLMMLELFKLATSRYADVRSKAQDILTAGFSYFPYSYAVIAPRLLEILALDPDDNHEAQKGLFYLLLGRRSDPMMTTRDWSFLRTLWPAIILSRPSEKLSVIRLKESLVDTVRRHFPMIGINLEVPDRCVRSAAALWNYSPRPETARPEDEEIERGLRATEQLSETNAGLYDGLVNDLLRAILEENPHWRHRSMAMNFIKDLVHPDRPYPVKVVRYFLNALVHESLEERKIATKTVVCMLTQQKRKHPKIEVDLSELRAQGHPRIEPSDEWYPGVRSDNAWLQYNHETRPLTEEQWNESRFVHQPYMGYYTWPKKFEVYAPSPQQPSLDPSTRVLTDHEKEIDKFFSDPNNVEKLIRYNSLEERKGKDKFDSFRSQLFKGLFRNHGSVHLKHFLPHLKRLVAESQESSQRCAAEITAGLIRGSKHWPFRMTAQMWEELTPIIRIALNNLTVETVHDWGTCFCLAQERRDPNRQHWLLECLMEEPPLGDSTTSFVECGRLYILQTALGLQSWRVAELMERLLSRVEERLLTNPFQNVRGRLGSLLSTVYAGHLSFPGSEHDRLSPRAQDLLRKVMPTLRQLAEDPRSRVDDVGPEASTSSVAIDPTNNEQTIRLFKIICKWLVASAYRLLDGTLPDFYELFPIACLMETCETDEELSKNCSCALAVLAQTLTLPRDMRVGLNAVKNMSRSSSWSARAAVLTFLEVHVFYNMGVVLSNQEFVNSVQEIVLQLLEDERLEVREKAGQVLGGLLHCTFIPEQETLLDEFKSKSKRRIKKRDDLRLRHAGVLGLCAFIRAHPYDVPKYVPSVFEHLGLHLNDPQPIPSTIRKTLSDFKRTHYDGWAGHALRFTEEQLGVLQDLTVPPSYYA